MTDRYARFAKIVDRSLKKWKQGVCTLTRLTDTGVPIDAGAPWLGNVMTSATYTLDATVSAVTVDEANAKFIDGTVITSADLVLTCAVPAVVPVMTDTITIDSKVRVIKKILQLPSAGTPVAFKIYIAG